MNDKKKLNKAIKSAREENQKVSLLIHEAKKISSLKNQSFTTYDDIIFSYVVIVLEHHRSIVELTNIRQISALALVRPLYEAYIRAHWLSTQVGSSKTYKATKQLINDVKDGAFPTLTEMCNDIDKWYNQINNFMDMNYQSHFTRELEHNKKIFHSYTHGGAYLVSIISNSKDKFDYKDMMNILEQITLYMFSATFDYASFAGNKELGNKIRAIMNLKA